MTLIHDFNNMSAALLRSDELSLVASSRGEDPLPGLKEHWKTVLDETGCYLSVASGCIVPLVASYATFRTFIGLLNSESDAVSYTERCRCLETLVRSISLSILEHQPHFSQIPHLQDQLGMLCPIAESLHMADQVAGLFAYSNYLQRGILAEYLLATSEEMFLFPPTVAGSPGLWHHDATGALLYRRWDGAIQLLDALDKNPEAVEFSRPLRENLLLCVTKALADLEGNLLREDDRAHLATIAATLRMRMEG